MRTFPALLQQLHELVAEHQTRIPGLGDHDRIKFALSQLRALPVRRQPDPEALAMIELASREGMSASSTADEVADTLLASQYFLRGLLVPSEYEQMPAFSLN